MDPKFRSDMTVRLVNDQASDRSVIYAARVSTAGESDLGLGQLVLESEHQLIRWLMRNRHGSPFEHNSMTFYVEAPIFVFREFMRHRIASYNEESGRYKQLQPVFYTPSDKRNLVQQGKPGAYVFVPGTLDQAELVREEIWASAIESYQRYENMLNAGIAREVARVVLPLNIYSSMYVTMNARALMNFLSLRVKAENSMFPSFPQREIEMVAELMEADFREAMPIVHAAFVASGRVAP